MKYLNVFVTGTFNAYCIYCSSVAVKLFCYSSSISCEFLLFVSS